LAFIPVPNGIQLCFNFTTDSQLWQFCLTLRKSSGAPTPTDLASVAAIGEAWWTADLQDHISSATTLRNVTATDLTVQGGAQAIDTVNDAGALTGYPLPAGSPCCVSLRTAKRGRSYRGRVYVSGMSEDNTQTANTFTSAFVAAIAGDFVSLQNDLDTAGFDIVVASKQHNGVVTNPAEVNEVIAIAADTAIDSQRRRLTGRGT